jgi:DNA-binding PadR family transcriptional regulator
MDRAGSPSRHRRPDPLAREILLAFWKVHILHHAAEGPIYGHWVLGELRRHGFEVSPGTLYPLLARMTGHGWLRAEKQARGASPKARRSYILTPRGASTLRRLREQVAELHREVVLEAPTAGRVRRRVERG